MLAVAPLAPSLPSARRGWYATAIIIGALVLAAIDRQILTLLVQPIQATLKVSDTQISLLYGLAFVGLYASGTLGVGWMADRWHRPSIVAVGVLLWSVMTASCGFAASFAVLLLSRAGVGLGEAAVVPAGYSLVAEHFPADQRGRVIGVLHGAATLGGGASLIIGGAVIALIGTAPLAVPMVGVVAPWQGSFLLLGMAGMPFALLVWTIREPRGSSSGRVHKAIQSPAPTFAALPFLRAHATTFAAIYFSAACNSTAGIGLLNWAPTLLARRFGTTPATAGLMIGIALIVGGVAGALVTGPLSDGWLRSGSVGGRIRGNPLVFAVAALGALLLALGPTPIACAAGFAFVAYGLNAVNAVSYAAAQDIVPPPLRSRALAGLHFTISIVGYSLGSSLVALFTDFVYRDKQMLGWAMLSAATPLLLSGGIVALLARRAMTRTLAAV